jgi:hypothetical protein
MKDEPSAGRVAPLQRYSRPWQACIEYASAGLEQELDRLWRNLTGFSVSSRTP